MSVSHHVVTALSAVPCEVIAPNSDEARRLESQMVTQFPRTRWGTVAWRPNQEALRFAVDSDRQAAERLAAIIDERSTSPDDAFLVFFFDSAAPVVRIRSVDLVSHALAVVTADADVWVTPLDLAWCIEVFHEGEVSVGKARSLEGILEVIERLTEWHRATIADIRDRKSAAAQLIALKGAIEWSINCIELCERSSIDPRIHAPAVVGEPAWEVDVERTRTIAPDQPDVSVYAKFPDRKLRLDVGDVVLFKRSNRQKRGKGRG
jgi:hypothetical protein